MVLISIVEEGESLRAFMLDELPRIQVNVRSIINTFFNKFIFLPPIKILCVEYRVYEK